MSKGHKIHPVPKNNSLQLMIIQRFPLEHYFCARLLYKNWRKLPIVPYNQTHFNESVFSWLFDTCYQD